MVDIFIILVLKVNFVLNFIIFIGKVVVDPRPQKNNISGL